MSWEVEYTNEFGDWWETLDEAEQIEITARVELIEEKGPQLPSPYSSDIESSEFGEMRELRIQHKGDPYRIFYAFDPRRMAILLIGGKKTGEERFYEKYVPEADKLYREHLEEIS